MNEIEALKAELAIQKKIAYTSGLLQGDITIKTLIESLAEGVLIINNQGRIILINNRMADMTGYSKEEVMGKFMSIFMPEKYRKVHDEHIRSYFSTPRIRPMGIGMELQAIKKDGSSFPIEISLSHLETETGNLGIAFITDITWRKKAETELKELNEALDSYARTVAHNLNSSVAGMINLSELLIDPTSNLNEETRNKYLSEIVKGGHKMSGIIKELLLYAKIKKGEIEKSKVDMNQVVQSAIDRLISQIKEKNAEVTIKGKLLSCTSHAAWIEEVVFNLISNAISYGGNPPLITIESEVYDNNYIKYSVSDNGAGISDELREVIFEDNNEVKNKHIRGFGLGLNIVKKIIDKLDGKIIIEPNSGPGSTFSFFLDK